MLAPFPRLFQRFGGQNASGVPLLIALTAILVSTLSPLPARATDVGGSILIDTTWDMSGSPYVVTDTVFVRDGATLSIMPGVEVRLDPSKSILALDSAITANGTADSTILFTRNQALLWGTVAAYGTQASVTLRHCVLEYGDRLAYFNGTDPLPVNLDGLVATTLSAGIIEDCVLRHAGTDGAMLRSGSAIFRRNLVLDTFRQGINMDGEVTGLVEDNRMEMIGDDAFDITSPNGEEIIFRNNIAVDVGTNNPHGDGLDIDHVRVFVKFSNFEVYDVADKGVSVSLNSKSVVVENMIVVGARGQQNAESAAYTVSNNSNLSVFNCVAYDCKQAFSAFHTPNFAGGNMVVASSIAWNTDFYPVFVDTPSSMIIIHSILDTPEPYEGGFANSNADPRFLDPEANDFRLRFDSPAIDAGWSDAMPEFDIRGNPRVDHPGVPDTGAPPPLTYYDIGVHEFDPTVLGTDAAPPHGGRFRLRAYPSPAPGPAGIAFELPDGRSVEIGVYDPAGRLVEHVFRGALPAGAHNLPLTFRSNGRGGVANGVYFIRLRAGDEVAVEKVVRAR